MPAQARIKEGGLEAICEWPIQLKGTSPVRKRVLRKLHRDKGLIATVTVLGLLLFSFIVYQLVQYLRSRPPRLIDPNVRMEILDLRNRPTRTTIGKPILKTPVETKESSSRPFVDSLRRSNRTYDDASQYEDELEDPRGPGH